MEAQISRIGKRTPAVCTSVGLLVMLRRAVSPEVALVQEVGAALLANVRPLAGVLAKMPLQGHGLRKGLGAKF